MACCLNPRPTLSFLNSLRHYRITPGSKAAQGDLCPGDTILAINGDSTETMTHMEAQNKIKACTGQLILAINRSEGKVWSPTVLEDGKTSPFRANPEPEYQVVEEGQHLQGSGGGEGGGVGPVERAQEPPRFLGPATPYVTSDQSPPPQRHSGQDSFRPIGSGQIKKPVQYVPEVPLNNGNSKANVQYNNPAGLYANNNGNGALPKQMGNLNLGSRHSPEPQVQSPGGRNGFNPESDVYKMLQDYEEPVSAPKQSGSFRYLQGILEAEDGAAFFFLTDELLPCQPLEWQPYLTCELRSALAGRDGAFGRQPDGAPRSNMLLLCRETSAAKRRPRASSPQRSVSPTDRMRGLRSPVRSPVPKLGSPIPCSVPGLQKLPQCTRCGNGIV
ncbi:hypothetical protein JZ751_022481 [Albula glossodonta]|uniref:PDZ domain-containing protein n=1 Tax=Albula glossodonta TaxID=121402 RepID=A0A8T2NIG2_9TELE|nr:hypothetical protein JZ751_022481 [Albula glossodonta]